MSTYACCAPWCLRGAVRCGVYVGGCVHVHYVLCVWAAFEHRVGCAQQPVCPVCPPGAGVCCIGLPGCCVRGCKRVCCGNFVQHQTDVVEQSGVTFAAASCAEDARRAMLAFASHPIGVGALLRVPGVSCAGQHRGSQGRAAAGGCVVVVAPRVSAWHGLHDADCRCAGLQVCLSQRRVLPSSCRATACTTSMGATVV